MLNNDDITLEDPEMFTLMLSSPSDSRVQIGGAVSNVDFFAETEIIVLHDDSKEIFTNHILSRSSNVDVISYKFTSSTTNPA